MGTTGGLASDSRAVDPATAPLVGIVTPLDEIKMWSEVAFSDAAPRGARAAAADVYRALEPLKERLETLESAEAMAEEDALDLVDVIADCLDAAWRVGPGEPFSQRRAEHFMRAVGSLLVGHAQRRLRSRRVWADAFREVEGALRFCHRLLAKWEMVTAELTSMHWADGARAWRASRCDTHARDNL